MITQAVILSGVAATISVRVNPALPTTTYQVAQTSGSHTTAQPKCIATGDESEVTHTKMEALFPRQTFTKYHTSPLGGDVSLFYTSRRRFSVYMLLPVSSV